MKTCDKCGHANKDEAKFCGACGNRLEPAAPVQAEQKPGGVSCPVCGYKNRPGAQFCGQCGRDLSQVAEAEAVAAPVSAARAEIAAEPLAAPPPASGQEPQVAEALPVALAASTLPDAAGEEVVPEMVSMSSEPKAAATCSHCGTVIRYCPCCGQPLEG